jgi:hypothetical protein
MVDVDGKIIFILRQRDQGIIMSWLSGSRIPMVINGGSDWFTEMASPSRFPHQEGQTN